MATFAFVFNKTKYNQMSAKQKKVIDNHCTSEWAAKVAGPWADFEHAGIDKLKAEAGHEVYELNHEQLAEWRKATAPLEAKWAAGAKKAGVDPELAIKALRAELVKNKASY